MEDHVASDADGTSRYESLPLHETGRTVLHFRPLQEDDHDQIKELHDELFPVKYSSQFYKNVVCNKTTSGHPLLSRVVIVKGFDEESGSSLQPRTPYLDDLAQHVGIPSFQEDEIEDIVTIPSDSGPSADRLIGCIVGAFIDLLSMKTSEEDPIHQKLIIDPDRHSMMFYIMTLGTTKDYRKLGLATKLVKDCLTMVEQVPICGGFYLHVITYNIAAIKFYERLGFYRICEIENFYDIDGVKYNCYLYACFVNGNRPSFSVVLKSVYRKVFDFFVPLQQQIAEKN
jgi:ribosomal protein S18 acetylase RimI-like enzyme